jgi:hypothetical protein
MAEGTAQGAMGKYLGVPISGALAALVTWATAGWTGAIGSALVSLLAILAGICGLALTLYYRRQLAVLGANRRIAAERQAYDALRNSLAKGNMAARLYAERLTRFLDWIDRFFGDAGIADRTLFPHAFGLRTPAPLWTAPAFDRCLVLALIYPLVMIFGIWAISGHVGPAEAALGLRPDVAGWERGIVAVWFGLSILTLRRYTLRGISFWLCIVMYFCLFKIIPTAFGIAFGSFVAFNSFLSAGGTVVVFVVFLVLLALAALLRISGNVWTGVCLLSRATVR